MRSLWLFNLLLALVGLALAEGLLSVVLDRPSAIFAGRTPRQEAGSAEVQKAETEPAARRSEVPPLSEFAVIVEKELFRNPYPQPVSPQATRPAPPPPPAPPLPALLGTVFVGEERKAILKDQNRAEAYTVGQLVAGGTLVRIEADHVVIQRGGTESEIPLKASIAQAPKPPVSGRPGGRTQTKSPEPQPTSSVDSSAAGASAGSPATPSVKPEPEGGQKRYYRQEGTTPSERIRRLRESVLNRDRSRGQ